MEICHTRCSIRLRFSRPTPLILAASNLHRPDRSNTKHPFLHNSQDSYITVPNIPTNTMKRSSLSQCSLVQFVPGAVRPEVNAHLSIAKFFRWFISRGSSFVVCLRCSFQMHYDASSKIISYLLPGLDGRVMRKYVSDAPSKSQALIWAKTASKIDAFKAAEYYQCICDACKFTT